MVVEETLSPDDFFLDVCGVETDTAFVQRTTTKTFPDGSQTVQYVASWVPDDPSLASEKPARTATTPTERGRSWGLAIRLYRHGEGTIIRAAGWLRVLEDGLLVRGPHPFLETDRRTCTADRPLVPQESWDGAGAPAGHGVEP